MAAMKKEAICVFKFRYESCTTLPCELERILSDPLYKNKKICVLSVMGATRGGKSFLLNFFIMFLRALAQGPLQQSRRNGIPQWMNTDGLNGFRFEGGSEAVTVGICVWSEPFLIKASNGEDLVVLLMDTQGVFGSDTSKRDCASIFALSALLSSHIFLNAKNRFEEHHLEHLWLCCEIARMHGSASAYQNLVYLVRDWQESDDFGKKGGDVYFKNYLKAAPGQPPEVRARRDALQESFQHQSAFLLPYPGKKVAQSKHFEGKLEDVDEDFITEVASLLEGITFEAKTSDGEALTCQEWMDRVKVVKSHSATTVQEYGKIFEKNEIVEARSLYEVNCDLSAQSALKRLFEKHSDRLAAAVREENGVACVRRCMNQALEDLRNSNILGGVKHELVEKLQKQLEEVRKDTEASVEKEMNEKLLEGRHKKELKELEEKIRKIKRDADEGDSVDNTKSKDKTDNDSSWLPGVLDVARTVLPMVAPMITNWATQSDTPKTTASQLSPTPERYTPQFVAPQFYVVPPDYARSARVDYLGNLHHYHPNHGELNYSHPYHQGPPTPNSMSACSITRRPNLWPAGQNVADGQSHQHGILHSVFGHNSYSHHQQDTATPNVASNHKDQVPKPPSTQLPQGTGAKSNAQPPKGVGFQIPPSPFSLRFKKANTSKPE